MTQKPQKSARYLSLADDIRQQIESGQLQAGQKLPSHRELAKANETTLMTTRRALELLVAQGFLLIEHGNGTFVADQQLHEADLPLFSLKSQLAQKALATENRIVATFFDLDEEIEACLALGLASAEKLCMVERVRLINGQAAIFQRSFLPTQYASVLDHMSAEASLYDLLSQTEGRPVSHAKEYLNPINLPRYEATQLQTRNRTAAWFSARVSSLQNGQAVIYDQAFIRRDCMLLIVDRFGAMINSSLQWNSVQADQLHNIFRQALSAEMESL